MAPHIIVIIQQGLWASATGGWFYDAHQNMFCNTFHLYMWLFLLCLPLTLYLTMSFTPVVLAAYCAAVASVFVTIKFINHRLHFMYDTGVPVEEEPSEESDDHSGNHDGLNLADSHTNNDNTGETSEAIEMTTFATSSGRWPLSTAASSMTPPVLCSSRASESSGSGRRVMLTPANSVECLQKLMKDDAVNGAEKHNSRFIVDVNQLLQHIRGLKMNSISGVDQNPEGLQDGDERHSKPQFFLSAETVASAGNIAVIVDGVDRVSGHLSSNVQQTSAVIESGSKTPSLLRPTLSSPVRKGHGHRHRRAVRCVSTIGAVGNAPCDHFSPLLTDVDPREPQVVDAKCALKRRMAIRRHFQQNDRTQNEEKIALETFSTVGDVGSPVHSDLSSLSSYKETSPESETFPLPTVTQLVSVINADHCCRSVDFTKSGALAHSRDSLETYKTRTFRKSVDATSNTSEKAIVHREPSGSSLTPFRNNDSDSIQLSGVKWNAPAELSQFSENEHRQLDSDAIMSKSCSKEKTSDLDSGALAASIVAVIDMDRSAATCTCGGSQSETKSESSRTLTIGSSNMSRSVDRELSWPVGKPHHHSRSKSGSVAPAGNASSFACSSDAVADGMTKLNRHTAAEPESVSRCMAQSSWMSVSSDSDDDDSHTSDDIRSNSESSDSSSTLTNDEMNTSVINSQGCLNRHHHRHHRHHHRHPHHHHHHHHHRHHHSNSHVTKQHSDVNQLLPSLADSSCYEHVSAIRPATPMQASCIMPSTAVLDDFAGISCDLNCQSEQNFLSTLRTGAESPQEDERLMLEFHRTRGAIPKRRVTVDHHHPSGRLGVPRHREATRQLSLEAMDEQLRHRVLQILAKSTPREMEEELKKLRVELSAPKALSERNSPRRCGSERPATPRTRRELQLSKSEDSRVSRSKGHQSSHGRNKRPTPSFGADSGGKSELKALSSSRESSASNPNELLALLPSSASAGGAESAVPNQRRPVYSSRSSWCSLSNNVIESVADCRSNRHIAKSHDDTSSGAIHCFQDEYGNWLTYTFGEDDIVTTSVNPILDDMEKLKRASSSDESTFHDFLLQRPSMPVPSSSVAGEVASASCCHDSSSSSTGGTDTSKDSITTDASEVACKRPKRYYWLKLLPKQSIKVQLDRLDLLALLDRNTVTETVLCVALAVGVSLLGSLLLSHGFYHDFSVFWLCFVIASCQYSLIKSVQPDAASPMHGYNRVIIFSRPSYFCLCGCLVFALHYGGTWQDTAVKLYGAPFRVPEMIILGRDFVSVFLLCLPVIFTLGLLPQVNTFLMYILEQIEIHVFGGTASTSLVASVFSVIRSCLAVAALYGLCYIGIKDSFGSTNKSQHVLFSVFCGVLIPVCYHLSRSSSDPTVLWQLLARFVVPHSSNQSSDEVPDLADPLPRKLCNSVLERLKSDLIVCCASSVLVFAVSVSTAFRSPVLQPVLFDVLVYMTGALGLVVHYLIPHLRKEMPWMCCSQPLLVSHERGQFEVKVAARVMMFEKLYIWLYFFESNFMLPTLFLCALTQSTELIEKKFGIFIASFIIVVCSIKMFRSAFTNTSHQFLIVIFTRFFFQYDFSDYSESFLIDYFFMSILLSKVYELMLRLRFILTYIAPWQIPWGSAFHAFAQPFSVPHSAMLFLQAVVSAVLSAPLNPLLGSAIFITSYMRPLRFWERDYNTKRVDHTNTRLSSQLEYNPGADDNNLNSIFYEHLTRSLQHSLCGDIMMGRWGNVVQGDFFIIASDYLNALVHIIEMGNGFVTFQLRGLEFRGTYCQQREVEAISEDVEGDGGFCCCKPGHLPHFLSLNMAFSQRWLAWEVVVTKYILEGYSISDNNAAPMLQAYDLRKALITFYVKSIIYYTVRSLKLEQWLESETIRDGLRPTLDKNYVDLDPTFAATVDEDYDHRLSGVSKSSFCNVYLEWVQYCAARRDKSIDASKDSWLVTLCFGLSLLGRRALGTASHNNSSANVEFFLGGLHSLFKGDLRITSSRDEWVFSDMELLRRVVAPGIRMSLKLHQDHFTCPEEYDCHQTLYDAITGHEQLLVISHEADPAWRNAVLSNVPSLLALRHVFDDGTDEFKVIMLNKRFLSFRVIKVNRECVRGLWAGQLQELIFLRNRNPERGSIQNAKQALRNMINSSCDQPIGYPIYVSPLTTSFSGTNYQYTSIVGRESGFTTVLTAARNLWNRMRTRCGSSCTSGSNMRPDEGYSSCRGGSIPVAAGGCVLPNQCRSLSVHGGVGSGSIVEVGGTGTNLNVVHSVLVNRSVSAGNNSNSLTTGTSPACKSSRPLSSLTGLISTDSSRDFYSQRVLISDTSFVYDNINITTGRRSDVQWPNDDWRAAGGKSGWNGWSPNVGDEGTVVHRWTPGPRETVRRSSILADKTIFLIQIGDRYVPISEAGVTFIGIEV